MKTYYLLISAIISVLFFAACSSSVDDTSFDDSSLYESMKTSYGIEDVSSSITQSGTIPSVTVEEMRSVLETLQSNTHKTNNCLVETANDANFGGINEQNKKVVMRSEYDAKNRNGSLLENFLLSVELKFNIDNGQVYYYGTDYVYNSNLFDWRANGLSLSPAKDKGSFTYEFQSESFIYFKLTDRANSIVKVGVLFTGEYNFHTEKGVYSFQLEKTAK